ncbi:MAG: hypothetical protein KG003_13700 [Bacteroidetes bacterium]|nr:hypothetical protein [Bacteroidota bacterium]
MRKILIASVVVLFLITQSCCKDKNKIRPITTTLEISNEMKSYFVNYLVGTKWIYQDTIKTSKFDTIELVSNVSHDENDGGGTLSKGFELYFRPRKAKDFKIIVSPGANNSCFVKVDPLVAAAGAISFENNNGIWSSFVTYFDSIEITGNKYYKVITSPHNNMYQYNMHISKSQGIVFFQSRDVDSLPITGADYKLIKTIIP